MRDEERGVRTPPSSRNLQTTTQYDTNNNKNNINNNKSNHTSNNTNTKTKNEKGELGGTPPLCDASKNLRAKTFKLTIQST